MNAASATDRVIGPTVSIDTEQGMRPSIGNVPSVVLRPTVPFQADGVRIEPPVSEPTAQGTKPAPTATPEPLDEPPGVRWTSGSHGF